MHGPPETERAATLPGAAPFRYDGLPATTTEPESTEPGRRRQALPDLWIYDGRQVLGLIFSTASGLHSAVLENGRELGSYPTERRAAQAIFDAARRLKRVAA